MVNSLADSSRYYKTVLTKATADSPIQSIFIHTNTSYLNENYMVLTLARHIKHSNSIATVFGFVDENLKGVETKIVTWTPPALNNTLLPLKAPLCIEVDYSKARQAINALYRKKVIAKADYAEICQSLGELERCVTHLK